MDNLKQLSDNTFYIHGYTNVGIVKLNDDEVCVIDTGIDDSFANQIVQSLNANKWTLKFILNTHYHADHVGGNRYLQHIYNCPAYSVKSESMLSENTDIAVSLLYGGYPPKEMRDRLLQAKSSDVTDIETIELPLGFEYKRVDGHSLSMLVIKTPEDIWFLADTVLSERVLNSCHLTYNYDVSKYLDSLNVVKKLNGQLFIPSHGEPVENVTDLVDINRKNIENLIIEISEICVNPLSADEIFKKLYDKWGLTITFQTYSVIGSALKNILTYMYNKHLLNMTINDNRLLWRSI